MKRAPLFHLALGVWLGAVPAAAQEAEPAASSGDAEASSDDEEQWEVRGTDDQPVGLGIGPLIFVPTLEYRLRYRHFEGRELSSGGVSDTLRHRARLGLGVKWAERVGVFFQVQDVRTYGEEVTTVDYTADGFDLHQGYGWVAPFTNFRIQLGRQEIALENERLIGAAGWSEPGRSFDALRFMYEARGLRLDTFYSKVRENNVGLGIPGDDLSQRHLIAGNLHYDLMPEFGSGVTAVVQRDEGDGLRLNTIGAILGGTFASAVRYGVEGYYQFGSAYGDIRYSSYLLAADVRVTIDVETSPYLEAFGAFLSGDDDPSDATKTTFDTLYATHHKFYGEMDFFTDLPRDTEERGLREIGGAAGFSPTEGLSARVAYHFFQGMADRGDGLHTFGHEVDIKAVFEFWRYARIAAVYGVMLPGSLLEQRSSDPRAEHFIYSSAGVKF